MVFVLGSWHTTPNMLGIYSLLLLYVKDMAMAGGVRGCLESFRMGVLIIRKINQMLRTWVRTYSSPHTLQK